ncbi:hypothetical protein EJ08DRAFT_518484 [Tothia fuscella]|uniref:STI1/HOP DP domain-containing protein n=1 Tax=Tothia fuscella TaxID=1048955 RepID=A0A9P4TU80_9PEZI|nr:hypothetical protein EJ08DRAFT_518484 [Tothia fuscella]
MFSDPQLFQKLAANPKTAPLLADHQFMGKLAALQKDPRGAGADMMSDPRMLQVFSVLLGIDMSFGGGGPGGPDEAVFTAGGKGKKEASEDVDMPDVRPSSAKPSAARAEPEEVSESEEEEDEDAKAKKEAKEAADKEKALGTENYKKRQFDAAIEHYNKAWELHKDITYLTNLSAAYFEKKDYEKCIETCQNAIQEGREVLADFKLIAK